MTRRTVRKIQSFKARENQPIVNNRMPTYKAGTTIPARELLDWLGDDGDVLMVRVTWKREPYLIWKDDWEASDPA